MNHPNKSKLTLMKKIITAIILVFAINISYGQDCKVITESLQGTYEGDCKKGLAHGKGIAKGIDTYEGSFKKGLPNGTGKYTWSSGATYDGAWKKGQRDGFGILTTNVNGEENTKKGYWLKGKYFGEYKKGEESKTINKLSITNVSYREIGDGNTIYIKISRMDLYFIINSHSIQIILFSSIKILKPSGHFDMLENFR